MNSLVKSLQDMFSREDPDWRKSAQKIKKEKEVEKIGTIEAELLHLFDLLAGEWHKKNLHIGLTLKSSCCVMCNRYIELRNRLHKAVDEHKEKTGESFKLRRVY